MSSPVAGTPGPTIPPPPGPAAQTVKHVVVVILQNSSFDHLFATFPGANGITPTVPGYSQTNSASKAVTPFLLTDLAPPALKEGRTVYLDSIDGGLMDRYAINNGDIAMGYFDGTTDGISTLWSYAQQYALADNYFSSVIGEAPTNQLYMVAADDNNFPYSVQPVYGPCQKADSSAKAMVATNVGDQLSQAGVSWAVYRERMGDCKATLSTHDPFQYFTSTHDSPSLRDFSAMTTDLAAGNLPAVSFVIPDNSHDMHPGFAPVTSGAAFVDALIQQLQASPEWSNSAILVTWDSGGGWYDHVPPPTVDAQGLGSRVPLLVISPLAKKGYISHVQLDHVSILRFIQKNWGLATLNPRNTMSADLSDLFQ